MVRVTVCSWFLDLSTDEKPVANMFGQRLLVRYLLVDVLPSMRNHAVLDEEYYNTTSWRIKQVQFPARFGNRSTDPRRELTS